MQVKCHDLDKFGNGVALLPSGQKLFVEGALPEETVEVEITASSQAYQRARLKEIIHPSKYRVLPFCNFFEKCGGCTLQHLSYQGQLDYKSKMIEKLLLKESNQETSTKISAPLTSETRGYRNRAIFRIEKSNGAIGLFEAESNRVINIEHCPVQDEIFNEILCLIREKIFSKITIKDDLPSFIASRSNSAGQISLAIAFQGPNFGSTALWHILKNEPRILSIDVYEAARGTNYLWGSFRENIFLKEALFERMKISIPDHPDKELTFELNAGPGFFQTNLGTSQAMLQQAMQMLKLTKNDQVLDLFSGSAFFAIAAAQISDSVVAVEASLEAHSLAQKNIERNKLVNIRAVNANADRPADWPDKIKEMQPSAVIIDPPRRGISRSLMSCLKDQKPDKILTVNCKLSSFNIMQAQIREAGYQLREVVPVDLFPHTLHIEVMAIFERL